MLKVNLPNRATIDSLKIRIPDSKVEILSDTLKGSWILINDATGELDEFSSRNPFVRYDENGISVKFVRESQNLGDGKPISFLTMGIKAKMLKNRYFEGIHSGNLREVYNYLQNMNIASFSFESFLQAECTDVDFKRDYFYESDFIKPIRILHGKVKPTKHKYGAKVYTGSENVGLELSDRKTTNVLSSPFLKFYQKGKELLHHSREFFKNYLSEYEVQSIVRMETTVKNKKHFRSFDITDTSLENISSLSLEITSKFFDKAMKAHFMDSGISTKKVEGLSPTEQVYLNTLHVLMSEANLTFGQSVMYMLSGLDKVPKSRTKKKIEKVYFDYIKGGKVDLENEEISQFLSQIGFM